MKQPASLFDRLWDGHEIARLGSGSALIAIDRIFLHERTGAAALRSLAEAGREVVDPNRVFAVADHIVDTRPGRTDQTLMPGGQAFISETRAAAKAAGIRFFDVNDPDQGIVHVISPELGIILPGCTLIAPDSHTCTQGAFGALAWGIGSSEAEHAMAAGTLRLKKPKSMRVSFSGSLAQGVTPKDMIIQLIALHGAAGGKGHAVEFAGDAVMALDMEGRMTLCNMATEFSAMSGFIAPDEKTFAYLKGRQYAPTSDLWDQALAQWQSLKSDDGAVFDSEIVLDANAIAPMVSWGTSPESSVRIEGRVPDNAGVRALEYMALDKGQALQGLKIDAAFIGSCTNSRLSDLRRASHMLKGKKIAPGIKAICVPGSSRVKRAAEAEGIDKIFVEAGFEWRESGCSMCFYAGGESFAANSRVISTTNRNFESRQGPNVKTHIASPETVVASAIHGAISDPRKFS
ncbi:3-isopropylmalate dehydratase large subunit [Alterisphingorhabdus coralli]|uniref:3-isopropylmalate dehydratase n=1 Tax=Alterisphingorhabdus coralli TaxID=3071408 RepID=A0AA97F7I4_9SPHN|nr:3-isopropylmalate dehydratase large subunit [Parasphingorhabdus sp. SCSIO 66989]WOE75361.1 3-isopropylmalate dehydratase large subunit [Parasphingorhabdus sp. SCSIO 66989]